MAPAVPEYSSRSPKLLPLVPLALALLLRIRFTIESHRFAMERNFDGSVLLLHHPHGGPHGRYFCSDAELNSLLDPLCFLLRHLSSMLSTAVDTNSCNVRLFQLNIEAVLQSCHHPVKLHLDHFRLQFAKFSFPLSLGHNASTHRRQRSLEHLDQQ